MSKSHDLSVVMSVYNGQKYLGEAIESILQQTYSDFEFIIINDGSTDESGRIIELYCAKDKRIIPVHQQNMGLACSLNKGIELATGKYIARQDADDLSHPERLESQKAFLYNNPGMVLCGTWFEEINEGNGSIIRRYPIDDATIRKDIKYVNYFCHPSVMFSKKAFDQTGGYDESFAVAQDFELWMRLAQTGKIANLPEVMVKKRIGFSNTISWQNRTYKIQMVKKIIAKHFSSWQEVNFFKFFRYYFPLLVYGFIPKSLLKVIRNIRYRV